MASVDASNSCIPPSCPLDALVPPLPLTTRGERLVLDGGRINDDDSMLLYTSNRLVVVLFLNTNKPAFCYRGHTCQVTCAKFSPSGAYVASADVRGKLRVWSFDSEEHLCKLDLAVLAGPVRDLAWDFESKRICIVGERSEKAGGAECARVIQWDTGVSCGELGQHSRGRAASCDFKPKRPMRIVTGGQEDFCLYLNQGPPFKRIVDGSVSEHAHSKGGVNCVKYNKDGTLVVSVGSDKAVCVYDGKTCVLQAKMEAVHGGNIYACDWSSCGRYLLTCSADGTVKLLSYKEGELAIVHTWNVAAQQQVSAIELDTKVALGGMQMGCAFLKNDMPVSVGLNGQIAILPSPPGLSLGETNTDFEFLTGHTAPIAGLVIHHSNGTFYTGDTDGILCRWDLNTFKPVMRFSAADGSGNIDLLSKVHGGAISGLTVVRDSVLSVGWDDVIRISDLEGRVNPQAVSLESQPNGMATGTELVVIVTVGGLLLVKDGAVVSGLIPLEYSALSVCMSSDDAVVYVGGDDCKIHVYKVTASRDGLDQVHVIENGHLKPIHGLALSNDGSKLASADVRDVCVWDAADYGPLVAKSRWCFHTQRVTCLAWSPDDTVIASGGADDNIYLWSLAKKTTRVHYPFAHRGGVTGLEFLKKQEGLMLVSAGADACVNRWDVTNDIAKKFG